MDNYPLTDRNRVRQAPQRASYDRPLVHAVLDEGWVAHVAFVHEGAPFVIPLYYVRDCEQLLLHGARKARIMRALENGAPVSAAITHVDGLVFARSAFHHSINYRSVVIHGVTTRLEGTEKARAMDLLVERFEPGRSRLVRPANAQEDKATTIIALPLEHVSAKIRTGPPKDDKADLALDVRAGVLPLRLQAGPFEADHGSDPN